jgi:hypothetical protein
MEGFQLGMANGASPRMMPKTRDARVAFAEQSATFFPLMSEQRVVRLIDTCQSSVNGENDSGRGFSLMVAKRFHSFG